jgi:hypothetical protein
MSTIQSFRGFLAFLAENANINERTLSNDTKVIIQHLNTLIDHFNSGAAKNIDLAKGLISVRDAVEEENNSNEAEVLKVVLKDLASAKVTVPSGVNTFSDLLKKMNLKDLAK